jgi:ABC-type antimicrobial peptide transport system permease subunit
MAIGATRATVLRQLLTEAVLVSLMGGTLGSAFARLLLGWLSRWQGFDIPTHFLIVPDARVYFVAVGLSVVSGIIFGLLQGAPSVANRCDAYHQERQCADGALPPICSS